MNINDELAGADAKDELMALTTPSSNHQYVDWHDSIDGAFHFEKHFPNSTEYRNEFCPAFNKFIAKRAIKYVAVGTYVDFSNHDCQQQEPPALPDDIYVLQDMTMDWDDVA